jgi:hypothetical protein
MCQLGSLPQMPRGTCLFVPLGSFWGRGQHHKGMQSQVAWVWKQAVDGHVPASMHLVSRGSHAPDVTRCSALTAYA